MQGPSELQENSMAPQQLVCGYVVNRFVANH